MLVHRSDGRSDLRIRDVALRQSSARLDNMPVYRDDGGEGANICFGRDLVSSEVGFRSGDHRVRQESTAGTGYDSRVLGKRDGSRSSGNKDEYLKANHFEQVKRLVERAFSRYWSTQLGVKLLYCWRSTGWPTPTYLCTRCWLFVAWYLKAADEIGERKASSKHGTRGT